MPDPDPAADAADAPLPPTITRRSVDVGEGVHLNVLSAGDGLHGARTIVLVHGWSQSAAQFRFQLEGLASRYHVVAIDLRGHGDSDKPAHGYRIQRLAADLEAALDALGLQDVVILGHSMGCSVLWCHFDLYGSSRVARYVFCDQMSCIAINPAWTPQELADYGGLLGPDAITATCNALAGPEGGATTEVFLRTMVSPEMPPAQFRWIYQRNLQLPRAHAATLLYNHCHQDWRDVLPRIDRPTLYIGGQISNVPASAMIWNAAQGRDARLTLFSAEERGSHFMFIENPEAFNALLSAFID